MAIAPLVEQISYTDLYTRWERGNWRATELDFSRDRVDWTERMSDTQRRAALWNYSLFLHGEDSVADNLSPYIDAAPLEEQKYFLTTQQVDEARHAVFFERFMREVLEYDSASVHDSLERTRPELTWGFRNLFGLLDRTADELRADRSKPKLAAAVTLYHLVVEATVAQTGQHFIDDYLERDNLMPGFHEGMANVAADEQRHIAFGVKLLSDLVAADPECKDAVAEILREALRYSVALFIPPNWDLSYVECFGSTLEDLFEQGLVSLQSKLRAAGLHLEEMPGVLPLPSELSPREQAERSIRLVRAGILGEKTGPPARDRETMALVFDAVSRSIDHRRTPERPVTIQWDFTDAQPWQLRINNGDTRALPERAPHADLTFHCRWEDWVDVAMGRLDPRVALLKQRIRPRGSMRLLLRLPSMFAL
ncbi:MAG TPA: ribonucleotide-diphosphate reductase subunit beta [Solirubrobacteraceae bacterium]|nr:ribonucleotide-diphosphate reductase subunit beta [Solirubrobacteraceae bacterium]